MAGQGFRITRYPPEPGETGSPSRVTTSILMPGSGRVQEPGFAGVAPGIGLTIIEPVSVCHQVSTIGQRSWPMMLRYHIQASGLIGSPTLPRRRRDFSECLAGQLSPMRMNARIAVGAV